MHIEMLSGMLSLLLIPSVYAQESDSLRSLSLKEVTVIESSLRQYSKNALASETVHKDFIREHFAGNFTQTLNHIPGLQSMDIGSGFAKPMIRGLGFNRIAVSENGIKQEGQQWGADHGLEIDAFNVESVNILKGAASLLYGSDAMGGVIEISRPAIPASDSILAAVTLFQKTVNGTIGGSLMFALKHSDWYIKARYTEQHFGDYRIPTDSIVYLTRRLPVYRRLKNTAGIERDAALYLSYIHGSYYANLAVSNAYQKVGFFPGAHGIPSTSSLEDDGNARNIDLPYSKVNHFKVSSLHQYSYGNWTISDNIGFQCNHREEWSLFHTHYSTQTLPEHNPDLELAFLLNTVTNNLRIKWSNNTTWNNTIGIDLQYQNNTIQGYSFLLPKYNRQTVGFFGITEWHPSRQLMFNFGLRYDNGCIDIAGYQDTYLLTYLQQQGFDDDAIDYYQWRSYAVNRKFDDFSYSLGCVWNVQKNQVFKLNIGKSFRLPGANELASNGVHHGTFRHEQGSADLQSERGWQFDISYLLSNRNCQLSISPFLSYFRNYIYLKTTGTWSILPHAGQIYRYMGAKALFTGGELSFTYNLTSHWQYKFSGEYVYTRNCDEHTAMCFSPPAVFRNQLTWLYSGLKLYAEWHKIAAQNRIAQNEDKTDGTDLFNFGGSKNINWKNTKIEITFSASNLFNRKYYNHLSFYRKIELPEPGRNFQFLITIYR